MDDSPRPVRHYAPDLTAPGKPQRVGAPRPGHGTVYVRREGGTPRYPEITWAASWIDEYDRPNENGEVYGAEEYEGAGTRADVLSWARSRPAASRLIGENGWKPLPDND
jgi:hypothetical protein